MTTEQTEPIKHTRRNLLDAEPIKVLDHGYVKLIDFMGSDETVIEAARMSTGKGFRGWGERYECAGGCGRWGSDVGIGEGPESLDSYCTNGGPHDVKVVKGDEKLLEYLYRNQHMTPFEMCELSIEVQAPIFVFREWHRHRTQSFNEASARYEKMPDLHYLPEPERFQKQSATNKQGSAEAFDAKTAEQMRFYLGHEQGSIYEEYEEMISKGLAKEVARINTPVSRYSKMRAKTDLRNWFGFLNLRMRPNAQWEIRQFAQACASIVKVLWPRSYALFEEYDLNGARLSASEVKVVQALIANNEVIVDGADVLAKKLRGGT